MRNSHAFRFTLLFLAPAGLAVATPGLAQSSPATPSTLDQLNAAAAQLPGFLNDTADLRSIFSTDFLSAVPEPQIRAITAQLRQNYGMAQQISGQELNPQERAALVRITYPAATVHIRLSIDTEGKIAGLRIVDVTTNNDSFAALTQDLAALPGRIAWGVYRIDGDGEPTLLHGAGTDRDMAVASTFKLIILGALDAEIAARRMTWSDVVPINRRSAQFSQINDWPEGAPATLHTLATLMISRSDNAATDILLHHIGRERVEAFARHNGGLSGPNAFPLLSTLEATVLKTHRDAGVTARWIAADEAERRRILQTLSPQWRVDDMQIARFADGPVAIEQIEWFASANAIARIMTWFDRSASESAKAILAVNPGISAAAAAAWEYAGYKGGSEPGVMSMSLLLRSAASTAPASYVVTMTWNNSDAVVDEAQLPSLLNRAAALLQAR